ncbi:MAG: SDR family NAD(P)-dependent oxidoreductase [Sedimenticolaceae bacterium]
MSGKKIAIVGYATRLPGASGAGLWENLRAGVDLVTNIPGDRFGVQAFYHPGKVQPGTFYTTRAGTIGEIGLFDAEFFGISPREAEQLDPQQRLLLEMAWEAFETGGIKPSSVRGGRGGVFIGFSGSDWSYRRADDLAALDATSMTGQTGSVAANRISYQFDLRGPSVAVDTACSSSLVAFHQACQSIEAGESDFALTGGIALHLHPYAFVGFARASMLSPRGVCNVFDADGDGYVRSEGGGVFLLKPLERAVADGDRIFAVVAGSGINCDGRTQGITVPGVDTQAALLREVYARAGVAAADIDYLEAHGTGTAVGDPIECRSLGLELGQNRPKDAPLLIGSVKSNMGHLETASGVAGMAKALLCLQHRAVPPTIHLNTPNPLIEFDAWNLRVVTRTTPLDPEKKLTIGVNSFGFGGANAHVVLQSPDTPPPADHAADRVAAGSVVPPLIVSGRGDAAARAAAAGMASYLEAHSDTPHYDVAYSAAYHREWHADRVIAFADDARDQARDLRRYAAGEAVSAVVSGRALVDASGPVLVFSGNGSQWAGMGRQLLDESPVFLDAVRAVDAIFEQYADFSIIGELRRDAAEQRLDLTEIAQPTLFALQVGITEMLCAQGTAPVAVIGHSVGEVAAAWACGALTLKQAVQVIYERSLHQGSTRGAGGMTAVGLSESACVELLGELQLAEKIAIAGVNSPRGVTAAGSVEDLGRLELLLAEREVFYRRLALDYAFHSAAMDPIRMPVERDLAGLKPGKGHIPFYSTVTGGVLSGSELDARYWWRNIREPVRFQGAVDALIADGFNLFVEVGPHAVLRTYVNDCLRARNTEGRVIPTLQRGEGDAYRVAAAFYQMIADGAVLNLHPAFPHKGRFVDIPTYAWQRQRYWHPVTPEGYRLFERCAEHPLLGFRLHENALQWESRLDLMSHPHLADHSVGDAVVFPAAGFIEMALAAAQSWHGGRLDREAAAVDMQTTAVAQEIEEMEIVAPLLLEESPSKSVRLAIDAGDGRFTIHSRQYLSDDAWQLHVVGRLPGSPAGGDAASQLDLPQRKVDIDGPAHYLLTSRVGLDYGPAYQAVSGVWVEGDGVSVTSRLTAPAAVAAEMSMHLLHPSLLDGCFQLLVDILRDEIGESGGAAFVPVKVGRLRLYGDGSRVSHAQALLTRRSPRSVVADFRLYDAAGDLVAKLDSVRFRGVMLRRPVVEHTGYLRFEAVPRPGAAPRPSVLPPNGQLPTVCAERLHDPGRQNNRRQYYDEVEPLLDVLCAAFAQQALRELSTDPRGVNLHHMLASGVIRDEFAPYARNLVAILQDDGILEPADEGLVWSSHDDLPASASIWTSLLGDYPDYCAEILMLGRVGEHMVDVLSGRLSAEALLPMDPSHPMLAHYLSGSPSRQAGNQAIAAMIESAMTRLAEGQRLRIVEFSCGYSQVAAQLLPRLDPDRCDYVLASTDADTLESYAPLVDLFPAVETWLIDLSDTPAKSGFDIVLLSQELAIAPQPDRLVSTLSSLLLPGGMLVVAEQPSARWLELVFGLYPDWWQTDVDQAIPKLRSASAWAASLARHGLADVTVINDLPGIKAGPYLLLARSSQAVPVAAAEVADSDGCWLILADAGGQGAVLAELLAARLRAAGHRPCVVAQGVGFASGCGGETGEPSQGTMGMASMLAGLREENGDPEGIVLLHGLPLAQTMPDAAAQRCVVAAELASACADAGIAPQLLVVTAGATADLVPGAPAAPVDDAALWGFGRSLMNEFPDMRVRLLELADPHDPEGAAGAIVNEVLAPDAEDEVIYAASGRYAPRLRTVGLADLLDSDAPVLDGHRAVRLDFRNPGPLKNLGWRAATLPTVTGDRVEIAVRAAGLNFRDIMYAMGLLSDEAVENGFAGPTLGMELSGVVTAVGPEVTDLGPGDEVIAFAPASFAERVVTPVTAVARKPPGWSFNAAATVPTTFFTAFYALHHLAKLEDGERLLIHGAAGGVGLAAIQLGRAMGAEIFATAGSDAKRDVVRLLGADHVLDSRSLAFADDVLALTEGQGVDVVLNSLAGEAINRNLRILRPFGRFLELGKRDFYENTRIGLRPFRNNISYFGIDADQLMAERPALTRRLFGELMGLFEDGTLKPLPYRAFPAAQAVEAFRYMQQSRQIGKVVLNFDDGLGPVEPHVPAPRKLTLTPKATYLVTGGMRGFGLETARWLASKGARHLVLLSRRGAADAEAAPSIEILQKQGVQVRAVACDVTDAAALEDVFDSIAETMPPLRGIVHAAMVIDDGLVRSLTAERITKVLAPKVQGARNLDTLSRDLQLDFFVLYSSATTLFGNPGQASYVAANRYLEVLAHTRRAAGLPAVCVSWGAIDDVGYLARNTKIKEQLQSRLGGSALTSAEALDALEQLLVCNLSGLGVMELEWGALKRFLPTALSPKFQELAHKADEAGADGDGFEQLQRWLEELDDDELGVLLGEALKKEIGEILHVSPERIDDGRSLYELGMDSLMGMELVSAVETRFGVTLPLMALSEGLTVTRLVQTIVRQLRGNDAAQPDTTQDMVAKVAAQHANAADEGLVQEVSAALDGQRSTQKSLMDDK